MRMPGRKFNAGSGYRYGFNGQEHSDDVTKGNYTAEYWEYDSRIGRRWNIDHVYQHSPYSTFANSPIINIDPKGAYFFKLFGSTSEQRKGARAFAKETDGVIKNITSKNLSVTYAYQKSADPMDIAVPSTGFYKDGFAKVFGKEAHKTFEYQSNGLKYGWGRINPSTGEFERIPASGRIDMVDDPITLLGPGLVRGLVSKLALAAAEKVAAKTALTVLEDVTVKQVVKLVPTAVNAAEEAATLSIRSDIVLSGGRSGQLVKSLEGPANSVLKGGKGRIFITNDEGKVIWDITKDRAKSVIPGQGLGAKVAPTQEQLNLVNQVWGQ